MKPKDLSDKAPLTKAIFPVLSAMTLLIILFAAAFLVVDYLTGASYAMPLTAGGLLMLLELILFSQISRSLINVTIDQNNNFTDRMLIALLLPIKFLLLFTPFYLFKDLGQEAMLPFVLGLSLIIPAIIFSALWSSWLKSES